LSKPRTNFLLGLALIIGIAGLIYAVSGFEGILYVAELCAWGAVAIYLWQKQSRVSNIIAACLVPALLWTKFMPKATRLAIKQLADKKSEAERTEA
jgi:hypothetical protein